MSNLVSAWARAENAFNAVERIAEYEDIESEAERIIEDSRPPKDWPSTGEIGASLCELEVPLEKWHD